MYLFRIGQLNLIPLLIASSPAFAQWQLNLTRGVTPTSHDIYNLHMTIFLVCCAIAAIVFGIMFYAMFHHRKAAGRTAAEFHEHFWVEISWTIIPLLILIAIAVPATKVLIHLNNPKDADITIKITGYQWKWRYEYLDHDVAFYSNNTTPYAQLYQHAPKDADYLRKVDKPLILPIHKKIRFLITSNDVIHAWWVPDFGVKRDAIPGYVNEAWTLIEKAGTYYGQCAELCGLNHAYMPIVVQAIPDAAFEKWLASQKTPTPPTPPAATQAPAATQTPATQSLTPATQPVTPTATATTQPAVTPATTPTAQPVTPATTQPPAATQQAVSPATTAAAPASAAMPATTATPQKLEDLIKKGETVFLNTCAVCHQPTGEGMPPTFPSLKGSKTLTGPKEIHVNTVLFGKPGTAMQAFKDQLSDDDLAAVITYERNAWGNNTKDVIQPADIAAAKKAPPP